MEKIPFLTDLEPSEKLIVILRLKKDAASKRMDYYRLRNKQNNITIIEGEKFESENRHLYEFIHIEQIFTLIQSVESFHGALTSAN